MVVEGSEWARKARTSIHTGRFRVINIGNQLYVDGCALDSLISQVFSTFCFLLSFHFGLCVSYCQCNSIHAAYHENHGTRSRGRLSSIMGVIVLVQCRLRLCSFIDQHRISVSWLFVIMGLLSGVLLSLSFWVTNRNKKLV